MSTLLLFFVLSCNTTTTENIKTETTTEKSDKETAQEIPAEPTAIPPDHLFDYMN